MKPEQSNCLLRRESVDIAIIGGGVHGCALACEAGSRGLTTTIVEAGDIACGASSRSHRVVGGDLAQLESLDLEAVNRCLQEQVVLRRRAPHLLRSHIFKIHPNIALRSRLKVKAGLYIYRKLQRLHGLPSDPREGLDSVGALKYCDDSVDDSRLTLALARQASDLGADVQTRMRLLNARRHRGEWHLELKSQTGEIYTLAAKILLNASGGSINDIMASRIDHCSRSRGRLIRDSYIVIKNPGSRLSPRLLQADNRQLIYLLDYPCHTQSVSSDAQAPASEYWVLGPWQRDTQAHQVDAGEALESQGELLNLYNRHVTRKISAADIVHSFSTLRCQCEDISCSGADITNDYALDLDSPAGAPPLLNVFGGNIVTHRLMAEQALTILEPFTGRVINPELKASPLPGGNLQGVEVDGLWRQLIKSYPALSSSLLHRYACSYGSYTQILLGGVSELVDLGWHFGAGLYQREVEYLCNCEWAKTAEDIVWRRSKLGLYLSAGEKAKLQAWLDDRAAH